MNYMAFMPLFWLILAVLLAICEALTVDLVAIWFAFGALVTIIPAWLKFPLWVQLGVFAIASIIALYFSRPIAKNILNVKTTKTNADQIVGMMGTVTEIIDNSAETGRIHVNGLDWKAFSDDGTPINSGEHVLVKEIKGVTLIVERV
ncbi:MAG: NfeD family protein [Oscillospiraceae bacterium]